MDSAKLTKIAKNVALSDTPEIARNSVQKFKVHPTQFGPMISREFARGEMLGLSDAELAKIAAHFPELKAVIRHKRPEAITESDPSLRPPKKWAAKMMKNLSAKYGRKAGEVMGGIWYHQLTPEKRAEIRQREGKHYGKANESMSDKKIAEWEIRNHGVDHSQYFPGVGVSHTDWDLVETGIGYSEKEAAEDALEQLASIGYEIPDELQAEVDGLSSEDDVSSIVNQDKPAEKWTVKHHSRAMGSVLDEQEFESEGEALEYVQNRLTKMQSMGLQVDELEAGKEWEVTEADDAVMVPDETGLITLSDNADEIEKFEQQASESELHVYVSIFVKESSASNESLSVKANGKTYGLSEGEEVAEEKVVKSGEYKGKQWKIVQTNSGSMGSSIDYKMVVPGVFSSDYFTSLEPWSLKREMTQMQSFVDADADESSKMVEARQPYKAVLNSSDTQDPIWVSAADMESAKKWLMKQKPGSEKDTADIEEIDVKTGKILKKHVFKGTAGGSWEPLSEGKSHIVAGFQYLRDLLDQGKDIDTDEANDHMKEVLGMNHDDIASAYEMIGDEIDDRLDMDEGKSLVEAKDIDSRAAELLKAYDKKIGIEKAVQDEIGEVSIGDNSFRYGGREVSASTPDGLTFVWDVNSYGDKHSYMLFQVFDENGEPVQEQKKVGKSIRESFSSDGPGIYVGTYKKYNEGSIEGKWLNPEDYSDAEEFQKAAQELHDDEADPELMFQDFQGFPERYYGESHIQPELWDWLKLDEDDRNLLEAYIEMTNDPKATIEDAQDKFLGKAEKLSDWVYDFIEETGGLKELPEQVLSSHLFLTETDIRVIASDESSARAGDMSGEEALEMAGKEEEHAAAEEAGDSAKAEEILRLAKEEAENEIHSQISKELKDDAISYFENMGFEVKELPDHGFSFNYEDYARDLEMSGDISSVKVDGEVYIFSA